MTTATAMTMITTTRLILMRITRMAPKACEST